MLSGENNDSGTWGRFLTNNPKELSGYFAVETAAKANLPHNKHSADEVLILGQHGYSRPILIASPAAPTRGL
jgi:hypothetical protein